jgi:hypothetical protein
LRRELAVGAGCYAAYLAVRRAVLTPAGRARARRNAERVRAVEQKLRIDVEPRVQEVAQGAPRVIHALNAGYAVLNVSLSVGWLIRLYRRRDPGFRRERRAAAAAFLGALPVFLTMPTAPPRTLDDFVDTLAASGIDLEHPFLVRFYNPLAAMPSHHVAFAVVTGTGLACRSGGLHRVKWGAYPPIVGLVVVATGNHFVLDIAAGAMLGALARRWTR